MGGSLLLFITFYGILLIDFGRVEGTSDSVYALTGGNYLEMTKDRSFYNAQVFKACTVTRSETCLLVFTAEAKALSMNVVASGPSSIECQLFENKADDHNKLILRNESSYYEKLENYLKATSSAINVGAKDDKPGTFLFQMPTGKYKIRLNHLNGGLVIDASQPIEMHFGTFTRGKYRPNKILLVKDFRGTIIADRWHFTEWEGDGSKTRFLATSQCFLLLQNSTYSFWHGSDHSNYYEEDNYGVTSFEMFVKLC